jgi:hypothetical protein
MDDYCLMFKCCNTLCFLKRGNTFQFVNVNLLFEVTASLFAGMEGRAPVVPFVLYCFTSSPTRRINRILLFILVSNDHYRYGRCLRGTQRRILAVEEECQSCRDTLLQFISSIQCILLHIPFYPFNLLYQLYQFSHHEHLYSRSIRRGHESACMGRYSR